jgi:hypothetical protein
MERDVTGLSLFLEQEMSPEALALKGRAKRYFIGRIQARQIRSLGLTLIREDDPERPGHVIVPELNAAGKTSAQSEFWQHQLAQACEVLGPLPGGGATRPA